MGINPVNPQKSRSPRNNSQVQRIIDKFGGVPTLIEALNDSGFPTTNATIYHWRTKRYAKGAQGLIPATYWAPIIKAARLYGILITVEDMDMRVRGEFGKDVGDEI